MKRRIRAIFTVLCAAILLCTVCITGASAEEKPDAVILFTHDLHSHFLPVPVSGGGESGGYARLATVLNAQREKYKDSAVVTVDGGDFSMGSLFQTIFTTSAAEFRVLGNMGFDATTFGNHEFDFRQAGLSKMLDAAAKARSGGETLPEVVQANYWPDKAGTDAYSDDDAAAKKAFDEFGVKEFVIIERGGYKFAMFGLLGSDADGDSPMSGMAFEETEAAARRVLADIEKAGGADFVICLSHSGTDGADLTGGDSEDYQLAKNVDGIDVIISGHTHSTLREALYVNDTYVVSCGSYAENLGVLKISKDADGKNKLIGYELIKIDENVEDDPETAQIIDKYKTMVAEDYLSGFEGMESFDKVIAHTDFDFDEAYGQVEDKAIGNIITDGYFYAMEKWAGNDNDGKPYDPVDIAVVPAGVIRGSFPKGDITVSNAFDVLSLGVGADTTAGYPLVSIYLTGAELKNGFEIDASISPFMSIAQLYVKGAEWEWNPHRMILNKVSEYRLVRADGSTEELKDDTLYHIITGQNCCQMLGKVSDFSKGLLKIEPKDKNGNPINDGGTYDTCIVHRADGSELKEWYSLASYLDSFDDRDGDGISDVPESFSSPVGNKIRIDSFSPAALLKSANIYTFAVIVLGAGVITGVFFAVRACVRRAKKKKKA